MYADGTLDTSFNASIGTGCPNNLVFVDQTSLDSQIIVCGSGITASSSSGTYYGLVRLNPDGSMDPNFAHILSTAEGTFAVARQSSGKILLGGSTMSLKDYPGQSFYLLRLSADGAVDTSYPMYSAPGASLYSIQAYPSDDPNYPDYVRLFGTIPRSDSSHVDYTVLLDSNGNAVAGHNIGDETVNGPILMMAYWGSNIVIAGSFTQVYDADTGTWKQMRGLARFTSFGGTLDTSFNIGSGANGHIKRITVVTDTNHPEGQARDQWEL